MDFIQTFREGQQVKGVYLCKTKQRLQAKNGKDYFSLNLQDKTGIVDGKVWEVNSPGIEEFDAPAYVFIEALVTVFNSKNQLNIRRIRKAKEGDYDPNDYMPVSLYDIETMYKELVSKINLVEEPHYKRLLEMIFIEDEKFIARFKKHSAAKTVHHSFVGGLLEHTLSVSRLCVHFASAYPVLNRDLLLTAGMCHDIGKTRELSAFPMNEYTDEGQFLGHIIIGVQMLQERIDQIDDFPEQLRMQLLHCILAHHGEYEFGSPKKPELVEALALNIIDNADAKMELFAQILSTGGNDWLGFNKLLDANVRRTLV